MSWTKKNVHPGKIVSTSQEVEVKILEVDEEKRRISLGLKQAQSNPWADFADKHPVGTQVEGEVKNSTEFGLFIGLDGDVDGMVHMSDIAWGVSGEEALALHHKGETVKAVVLDVDVEKERISLGMKQLERGGVAVGGGAAAAALARTRARRSPSPCSKCATAGLKCRSATTARPASSSAPTLAATATSSAPSASRSARSSTRRSPGFDRSKKPTFSIKALQISEEKQAVAQYGSSDAGASLGDILGEALKGKSRQEVSSTRRARPSVRGKGAGAWMQRCICALCTLRELC